MAWTRDFKELVQKRIARDPAFGDELWSETIDAMLSGDVETGRAFRLRGRILEHYGTVIGGAASRRCLTHQRGDILNQSEPTCSIASI